eukprot:5950020-Pyramimonas_sp.AAC.1
METGVSSSSGSAQQPANQEPNDVPMPEPENPAIGAFSKASKGDLCSLAQCYRNFGLAYTSNAQEVFKAPRVSALSGSFGLNPGFVSDFSVH